jgi:hypothetical protein
MKMPGVIVAVILWTVLSSGQEVKVTPGKDSVALSVSAQKPYDILASEKKIPVLSVQCSQKGKKSAHLVIFTTGGALAESDAEAGPKNGAFALHMVVGGKEQKTEWIPYTDPITYAYYGKSEPERVAFLQLLLSAPTASISFTPFLTGATATSVFDLSKLRDEIKSHPECAVQ